MKSPLVFLKANANYRNFFPAIRLERLHGRIHGDRSKTHLLPLCDYKRPAVRDKNHGLARNPLLPRQLVLRMDGFQVRFIDGRRTFSTRKRSSRKLFGG